MTGPKQSCGSGAEDQKRAVKESNLKTLGKSVIVSEDRDEKYNRIVSYLLLRGSISVYILVLWQLSEG